MNAWMNIVAVAGRTLPKRGLMLAAAPAAAAPMSVTIPPHHPKIVATKPASVAHVAAASAEALLLRSNSLWGRIRSVLRFFKGTKRKIFVAAVLAILASACGLLAPMALGGFWDALVRTLAYSRWSSADRARAGGDTGSWHTSDGASIADGSCDSCKSSASVCIVDRVRRGGGGRVAAHSACPV